jgi:hypothetical protein
MERRNSLSVTGVRWIASAAPPNVVEVVRFDSERHRIATVVRSRCGAAHRRSLVDCPIAPMGSPPTSIGQRLHKTGRRHTPDARATTDSVSAASSLVLSAELAGRRPTLGVSGMPYFVRRLACDIRPQSRRAYRRERPVPCRSRDGACLGLPVRQHGGTAIHLPRETTDTSENQMEFRTGRSALRLSGTGCRTVPKHNGATMHHTGRTRLDIGDFPGESVTCHRDVKVASRLPVALLRLSAAAHREAGTIVDVLLTDSHSARRCRTTTPRPHAWYGGSAATSAAPSIGRRDHWGEPSLTLAIRSHSGISLEFSSTSRFLSAIAPHLSHSKVQTSLLLAPRSAGATDARAGFR